MIIVTGAGGTVGGEVLGQLREKGVPVRAAFHSEDKAKAARDKGIEAVTLDLGDEESLQKAFEGCERLFLLGPNAPNQTELEKNAVEAARSAGIKHIVKLSVMAADQEEYLLGKIHREGEKAIEASGLDWTFIRANSFMQNTINYSGATIKEQSAIYSATGDKEISHVDVRDIAAVAVAALTEDGHASKAYDLNGPEALSYDDVTAQLSTALGREIKHIDIPLEHLRGAMLEQHMPEFMVDNLVDLERYYSEGNAAADHNDIKAVTGKEPRTFSDFAREMAGKGVWDNVASTGA